MRICVADDEKEVRESIILKLKQIDKQADIFDLGFGKSALDDILFIRPDLVFLDIMMPEMNGLDILQEVKRQLPDTTVAMLSGYSEFEYARKAIQLGAVDYLLKPADREQLKQIIDKVKYNMEHAFLNDLKPGLAALAGHSIYVGEIRCQDLSAWFDERQFKETIFGEPSGQEEAVFSFVVNQSDKGYVIKKDVLTEGSVFLERSQFPEVLQKSFEQWEARRFWGGNEPLGTPEPKSIARLRKEIVNMAKQSDNVKLQELEKVFGEWLACIRLLGLKQLRKEVVALMALLDEGMTEQQDWIVADEDKLRYWADWTHRYKTWEELRTILSKYVVQGIHALTALKSQPAHANLSFIEQAVKIINTRLITDTSLDGVAAELGVHPVTLSRMFKKQTGVNFVQYLIRRRLQAAQALLLQTNKTVSEVAEEVGYLDYRFFRTQFKKEFGMTPREYRSQNGIAARDEAE